MNRQRATLYFLTTLSLLFMWRINGQSMIVGSVLDKKGIALPSANVVLLTVPDSNFVGGTTTDEKGFFTLTSHSMEDYLLAIHMLGFNSVYVSVSSQQKTVEIPAITLNEGGIELNAIEVTAEKPLIIQSIDRTIVNLENRVAKIGTSALDLLEKLPGVVVDRQNETISLLGKDGLNLLINDRQQYLTGEALFNYLSGLNADNLKSVELITAPPANFDAQGNAGFINLQLKQYPGDGWNGGYALSAGYGNGETVNGSFDFNYRKKPLAIAVNYTMSHHGQGQFSTMERRVGSGENLLGTNTRLERDPYVNNHNLRLVMDYQRGDKMRFGSVLTAYVRHWNMDATYDIVFQPVNALDTLIEATLFEENDWKSLQGNLNFNYDFNDRAG
ncbi:MAG: TonB-dependent receptor, partial [Bacteroidota bacterium]